MKLLTLLFVLLPSMAYCQSELLPAKYMRLLERMTQQIPANIHDGAKMYPGREGRSRFDSVQAGLSDAFKVLADRANKKSYILNIIPYPGERGEMMAVVNEKMNDFFLGHDTKQLELEAALMKHVKRFEEKGAYKKGVVAVRDSLYQTRKTPLKQYCEAMLSLCREELKYLNDNIKLLGSTNEAEKIQHLEGQAKILAKLWAMNVLMQEVIYKEGSAYVEMCRDYPESCRKLEKYGSQ